MILSFFSNQHKTTIHFGGVHLKRIKTIGLTSVMIALLLTGCAGQKEMEEKNKALSAINDASLKVVDLKNGTYTYTASQNIEKEYNNISGDGTFINLENETIWYTQMSTGQLDNQTRTLTEEVQQSGKMYQRFGIVNENNEYIEENIIPEWKIIAEESNLSPLYLEELIEVDILAENIESIEFSNEGDHTVYELTYTEDYRDSVMEENIKELETALENQISESGDDFYISTLKKSIEKQQDTEYTNRKVLMKINKENILVYRLTEDSFDLSVNDTIQSGNVTIVTVIDDYNDSSIGIDVDI